MYGRHRNQLAPGQPVGPVAQGGMQQPGFLSGINGLPQPPPQALPQGQPPPVQPGMPQMPGMRQPPQARPAYGQPQQQAMQPRGQQVRPMNSLAPRY